MLLRIQKILADAGIASRRASEELIAQGRVKVNNNSIKLGDKADPDKDRITVDDSPLPKPEKKVYLVLNKPRGYVTTVTEPFGMPTVMELLNIKERVYPVGRLDKNSEGLLLLTNDGELTQKLIHPSYGVSKTYRIRLNENLRPFDTQRLLSGVFVEGRKVHVQRLHRIKPHEIIIDIHEGRKHIVRKLFEVLGYEVTKLTRLAFGPLRLKDLKPGQWRYLTKDEISMLQMAVREKRSISVTKNPHQRRFLPRRTMQFYRFKRF